MGGTLKRLIAIAAALALLLLLAPAPHPVRVALQPRVLVGGAALTLPADQQPLIENGLTLVPMRAIFEALGASIAWDDQTFTVTCTKGSTVVKITLNAAEATVNGISVPLAQPARLIGSRTYVPLRFVSEALGARVGWDGETATIRITETHPVRGGTATLPVEGICTSLLAHEPGTPDRVIRAIYGDGLLRHQPGSLQLEPALAVDMPTVSNDGRTCTFRLRKGITFHDGTEVTAADPHRPDAHCRLLGRARGRRPVPHRRPDGDLAYPGAQPGLLGDEDQPRGGAVVGSASLPRRQGGERPPQTADTGRN